MCALEFTMQRVIAWRLLCVRSSSSILVHGTLSNRRPTSGHRPVLRFVQRWERWGLKRPGLLQGHWLNEGGQSAAGALLDWTLHQSDARPLLEATSKAEERNVYALLND